MSEPSAAQQDPTAVMLSKAYVRLLVLCAGIGLICSLAAWLFLSTVPWMQDTLYTRLPSALGFAAEPWWWPLPVLVIAGLGRRFRLDRGVADMTVITVRSVRQAAGLGAIT